jgi:hypothetical protein
MTASMQRASFDGRVDTCLSPGVGPSIGRQPTTGAHAEADKHYLKESAVLTIAMREKQSREVP